MLPLRNAVGRDRFSLTTLASASPHGVGPLSEDITPSTQPVRVRKFACANVLILMSPEIAHDSYRVVRGTRYSSMSPGESPRHYLADSSIATMVFGAS